MSSSPAQAPPPSFASSPTLLRKKKDGPGGAFGVASKAFDALRDSVGAVGKMVALDAGQGVKSGSGKATSSHAVEEKKLSSSQQEITEAFSVALCHILAPLWSVGVDLLPIPASALPRLDYGSSGIMEFSARVVDQLPLDADVDVIADHLSRDRQYATAFIVIMLAKVLLLERTFQRGAQTALTISEEEFVRSSTQDLLANLEQELRVKSSEPTKDTWPNDETSTSDMPKRQLCEVGGAGNKPRGPTELSPFLSHYRRRCLIRALQVSACFPYYYCDAGIQYVCEAVGAQLFLVNFSEALVTLVSGRKGPCYAGKYIIHLAGARQNSKDAVDTLVSISSPSTTLTQVNSLVAMSFDNFMHRNDMAETVIPAMKHAIENSPQANLGAVLRTNRMILYNINCADIGLLVELMDAARRLCVSPRPVGDAALDLVRACWMTIRCVGCLQRDAMCRSFVAGAQMRSFRRRPIHLVTNTFASKSFVVPRTMRLAVQVQRGIQNYRIPVALSGRADPNTGQQLPPGEFSDDSLKYVSNVIINVFQAAVELCESGLELNEAKQVEESNPSEEESLNNINNSSGDFSNRNNNNNSSTSAAGGGGGGGGEKDTMSPTSRLLHAPSIRENVLNIARTIVEHVDLRILYSIPPSIMVGNVQKVIALFPKTISPNEYSDPAKLRIFSDLSHANAAALAAIYELYLNIADYAKPIRGVAKTYRNENAMRPVRPILTTVLTEQEPVSETFREMCMALWKHCDARVLDSEPASTHPQKDLALSQFVEDEMDIALCAGGGTLRRMAHAICAQRIEFPGTVPSPRFFIMPCGADNDLASWIARCDSTYRLHVYNPIVIRQPTNASVKPDELAQPSELAGHSPPTLDQLQLRRTIDYYAQNARYSNEVLVYQVDCYSADGTKGCTMMCSNFEIGFHMNVAATAVSHSSGKDSLGPVPVARSVKNRVSSPTSPSSPAASGSSYAPHLNPNFNHFVGIKDAGTSSTSSKNIETSSNVTAASGGGKVDESCGVKEFKFLAKPENEGNPTPWTGLQYTNSAKDYLKTSCNQLFVQIGEVIESADWLMLQMHGPQGLKLQSRKNPSDSNSTVPSCATGSEVLDWLGSVYHAFDSKSATKAAQHLLELGFLTCVAVSPGRSTTHFSELCLYIPRARGGSEAPTPALPTSKSRPYGIAMGIKDVLRSLSAVHDEATSGSGDQADQKNSPQAVRAGADLPKPIPQLACTVRVGFTHRPEDAHYHELSPPTEGGVPKEKQVVKPREVVFMKVRSCGSAGDAGPAADPCSCALEMSICEVGTCGRHDSIYPRDAVGANAEPLIPPLEQRHYTLHFGARDPHTGKLEIDPGCELAIDSALPPEENRTAPLGRDAGAPANLFCAIDGDVLGPFACFRIKPLLIDASEKKPATISVMSFTPLSSEY